MHHESLGGLFSLLAIALGFTVTYFILLGKNASIVGLFGSLVIGLACYCGLEGYLQHQLTQRFEKEGIPATATILEREKTGGRSTSYALTYEYTVADRTLTREELVSRRLYERSNVGERMEIQYLADEPHQAYILANPYAPQTFFKLGIGSFGLGFFLTSSDWLRRLPTKARRKRWWRKQRTYFQETEQPFLKMVGIRLGLRKPARPRKSKLSDDLKARLGMED